MALQPHNCNMKNAIIISVGLLLVAVVGYFLYKKYGKPAASTNTAPVADIFGNTPTTANITNTPANNIFGGVGRDIVQAGAGRG